MGRNATNWKDNRRHDWGTPDFIRDVICREFDIFADLCADVDNTFATDFVDEGRDLLSAGIEDYLKGILDRRTRGPRRPTAWMNPPYLTHGRTRHFVSRAIELSDALSFDLLILIPVSLGTKWQQETVLPNFELLCFPRRFPFKGAGDNAFFDAVIAWRRPRVEDRYMSLLDGRQPIASTRTIAREALAQLGQVLAPA